MSGAEPGRAVRRLGLVLMFWWGIYGMVHLLWLRSLWRTYEFSSAGVDVPEGLVVPLALLTGVLMLVVGGVAGRFSDGQPSRLLSSSGQIALAVLLTASLLALVRVVLGVGPLLSGETSAMGVVAEVWFLVAGLGGLLLCGMLLVRRRQLRRHRASTVR